MIPYDLDPSLHHAPPHEPMLDDGFSPPSGDSPQPSLADGTAPSTVSHPAPNSPQLRDKSAF